MRYMVATAGGIAALVMAIVLAHQPREAAAAGDKITSPRSDMPFGISVVATRRNAQRRGADADADGGGDAGFGTGSNVRIVFADVGGRPLYTFDSDVESGKSACVDECAKTWQPLLASDGDKPFGEWSVVKRSDTEQQWAFRGRPLYTYAKDVLPRDNPLAENGWRQPQLPGLAAGDGLNKLWHVAEVSPAKLLQTPDGITVTENLMAQGWVLATPKGQALYAFAGKDSAAEHLTGNWEPLVAGLVELPVGDFSIHEGGNGIRQWAYRGQPLYTFSQDSEPFDLNGVNEASGMAPVILFQYFVPQEVAVASDLRRGGKLTEAKTGRTLYARDRIMFNHTNFARGLPRGGREIGISIGLSGCDATCGQTWKPLLAPAGARPSGYWAILDRPDGSKQWSYQGYALYTNSTEPPGAVQHHQEVDLAVNFGTQNLAPAVDLFGLEWRVAVP